MDEKLTKQQLKQILAIRNDFYRFCKNNLYIKNKYAKIVKFKPNKPQKALIDYVIWCLDKGIPIRVIILKARQMGLSTAVEAIIYWWTSTHKNITSVIIGHEEASAKNLYLMFRRYYDNSNILFKPTVKYNTKTDLSFERYDDEGKQVGLASLIKTATAKNTSAGRSDTIHLLHASEVGEWENGEDLIASIMQTVPMLPETMIFLESTAKGRGNYFHKEWINAESGENSFKPFFFPWWLIDEYAFTSIYMKDAYPNIKPVSKSLENLSFYEEFLVATMKHGYNTWNGDHYSVSEKDIPGKLNFYRAKASEFASDPIRMYQEYPTTSHEAFVASGANVFDQLALEELERECIDDSEVAHYNIDIGDYEGEIILDYVPYDSKIKENNGKLKVWSEPKHGREYVIGADVAEGLATGDYSVAEVVDTSTMETVARWRGHIDPDKFGGVLAAIGTYYNYSLIGVEINNHGLTTVQKLRDIFYTNLYKREQGYDEDFEEPTSHLGWKTDARTKRIAIDSLVRLIREKINKDKDKVFIDEAFAYVRDERGRTNAEVGEHDDTVMAKAIAFQLFEWGDNDLSSLKVHIPKNIVERKKQNRNKI